MELRHLRYFQVVAEELHVGRAAQRLHMAQPPLSRQIQALEAELGLRLFDRTRRGVALTPAGAAFHERCRAVFSSIDQAAAAARRAAVGEIGRIAIGYVSSLAYVGLGEVLRAFRAASPHVDVVVREGPPQEQLDAIVDGRLDVGFLRGPVAEPGLVAEVARREVLAAALPPRHRLARRARLELHELAGEPFIFFPRARSPSFYDQVMSLCRAAGFTPRVVQEAPLMDVVSLVSAGYGVALVPQSFRRVGRGGMSVRPVVGAPRADLMLVRRADDQTPALLRFLDVARKQLRAIQLRAM
jgi:DNA-binding transcriptional LysR family regulator